MLFPFRSVNLYFNVQIIIQYCKHKNINGANEINKNISIQRYLKDEVNLLESIIYHSQRRGTGTSTKKLRNFMIINC